MKLNFIEDRKRAKEEKKRQKEEELRKKREQEEKTRKKTLTYCAMGFAVLLLIGWIGSLSEKDEIPPPEPSSVMETGTISPDETLEPSPSSTVEPSPSATVEPTQATPVPSIDLAGIPSFSGSPYVALNNNEPSFTEADYTTASFESYSSLDSLGRCGVAYASISPDTMPTSERGEIEQVKPSGWHTVKYDCVDGKYLYNRCHLIGWQLTAENANNKNLITGTRYMNVDGMLPFENMVADYIKETGNHVLYRVTPIFDGDNLVASGVQMEALSMEDSGSGICFNVYCYNAQPEVTIDYATGESKFADEGAVATAPPEIPTPAPTTAQSVGTTYILNTNTYKFHYPTCSSVNQMKEANKQESTGSRDDLIAQGYSPCGRCNP